MQRRILQILLVRAGVSLRGLTALKSRSFGSIATLAASKLVGDC
jgi:hypothetical protein